MTTSEAIIELTERYGANNYHPLPIVLSKGEGVWVEDADGNRYMDMLSAYSALNHGHRHPRIIAALKEQADRITLTSRAFHNDQLGKFLPEGGGTDGKRDGPADEHRGGGGGNGHQGDPPLGLRREGNPPGSGGDHRL